MAHYGRPEAPLKLVNWNVEWATAGSKRFPMIRQCIARHEPNLICITEGQASVLPETGHAITSLADYGYGNRHLDRRKVLLWSRQPWTKLDTLGDPGLPSGRFACGITETPLGLVRCVGVCIPWRDAHVRTGRKDRQPWEDHLAYLDGLTRVLTRFTDGTPTIVLGDFNQRIPPAAAPRRVSDRLALTLQGWQVVTAGTLAGSPRLAIDHVAIDRSLEAISVLAWPGTEESGARLSDHDGQFLEIRQLQASSDVGVPSRRTC